MKKNDYLTRGLFLLFAGMSIVSCVDSDYDLSKDIDMTAGLGTNGLALKLGNTERIYLKNVLKVEDSEMLDTLSNGMYYLIKEGSTNVNVKVNPIDDIKLNDVELFTTPIIDNSDSDLSVSTGTEYSNSVSGTSDLDITIDNIPDEVENIRSIVIKEGYAKMALKLNQPAGSNFRFRKLDNVEIEFPDFIHSSQFKPGTHILVVNRTNINVSEITDITLKIDSIVFTSEGDFGKRVVDGKIDIVEPVNLTGDVTIVAASNFTLPKDSKVTVKMEASLNRMSASSLTGLVNPTINPEVDPIEISKDLPDFLKDNSVKLEITNPTLRFHVIGTELPIPLLFSAQATSIKDKATKATVELPQEGSANIPAHKDYNFYFFQADKPFTPENDKYTEDQLYKVNNLSSLVQYLPDYIDVNLSDGRVHANQSQLHTIDLGKDYNINMNYDVYIPFQFNANTCIVYNDSVDNMNKDLKKYQAEGITVTTTAFNTIPLDLDVTLIPYDINGKDLSQELVVDHAIAKAGDNSNTPIQSSMTIKLHPKQPSVISRLDKLVFSVSAKSVASSTLVSNQYLEMKEIRLKLDGKIIANFN